jgi:hypothetical protein
LKDEAGLETGLSALAGLQCLTFHFWAGC